MGLHAGLLTPSASPSFERLESSGSAKGTSARLVATSSTGKLLSDAELLVAFLLLVAMASNLLPMASA